MRTFGMIIRSARENAAARRNHQEEKNVQNELKLENTSLTSFKNKNEKHSIQALLS